MPKTDLKTERTGSHSWRPKISHAVAMVSISIIATAMIVLAACQRKPVMAHAQFMHLPVQGWQRTMPLTFLPEYDDSASTYQLTLAVRHDNAYLYRNLSLAVDIIGVDSTVNRKVINMTLADEFGNWAGGGFGALYQDKTVVEAGVTPDKARSVVVWHTMSGCDTLCGVVDVGIIVTPK